jgi:hypothetical protein
VAILFALVAFVSAGFSSHATSHNARHVVATPLDSVGGLGGGG